MHYAPQYVSIVAGMWAALMVTVIFILVVRIP
jgi:hypothetical protein